MSQQPDNHPMRRFRLGPHFEAHPFVFPAGAGVMALAVALCFFWPTSNLEKNFQLIRDGIGAWFGWLYIGLLSAFVLLAIVLALGPYGRIRLGGDEERPEFRWWSWLAMLFSAGMGIGLLFYGVAEPSMHFQTPPPGYGDRWANRDLAMAVTMFHWGLHPWALYSLVAMMLAYAGFRMKLPLTFRSLLFPWLGNRIWGRAGDLVDTFAVIATLAGVATSLGIGAQQVNAGLAFLFGVPINPTIQVILIVLITAIATASVVAGLDAGIRRLSEFNMALAALLLVLVIVGGGVGWFFRDAISNAWNYFGVFPSKSVSTGIFAPAQQPWLINWTVFYWAWWISWCPFVGMFIARVSRGRTIREFVLGVLAVPTLVGLIWFTGFGNTALRLHFAQRQVTTADAGVDRRDDAEPTSAPGPTSSGEPNPASDPNANPATSEKSVMGPIESLPKFWVGVQDDEGNWVRREDSSIQREQLSLTVVEYLSAPVVTADGASSIDTLSTVLFVMLEQLYGTGDGWLSRVMMFFSAGAATLCIVLFFVTSSDSASMVIDMIASGGNPDPPVGTRLFWAISEGLVAAALLVAGGLLALQAAAVAAALPLTLILIAATCAFLRALRRDVKSQAI